MAGYTVEHDFELPVEHGGATHLLKATLRQMGYTYRIIIHLNEQEIIFERDEEQQWRARTETDSRTTIPASWFKSIGEALEREFQ